MNEKNQITVTLVKNISTEMFSLTNNARKITLLCNQLKFLTNNAIAKPTIKINSRTTYKNNQSLRCQTEHVHSSDQA